MSRRVFLAINLPERTKNQLAKIQKRFFDWSGRLTKKESLHLTLLFLGYLDDEQIYSLIGQLKQIQGLGAFDLRFDQITYGPPGKTPRMIWVSGPENKMLTALKNKVEDVVARGCWHRQNQQKFTPHITLMRLKNGRPGQLSATKEKIDITFPVWSFELMESRLKRSGAEYCILESFSLD